MLENGLVLPGTPSRAIAIEREILRLKELYAHMDILVKTLRKNSNVVIKFSDNETRDCKPLMKYRNDQYPYSSYALYLFFFFWGVSAYSRLGA